MMATTGHMTDAAARAGQSAASHAASSRSLQCAWECAGTGCARGWRSAMTAIVRAGMGAALFAQWRQAAHAVGPMLTGVVGDPGTGARQDVGRARGQQDRSRSVMTATPNRGMAAAAPARSSVDSCARESELTRQTNALLEDAETRFWEALRSATTATLWMETGALRAA